AAGMVRIRRASGGASTRTSRANRRTGAITPGGPAARRGGTRGGPGFAPPGGGPAPGGGGGLGRGGAGGRARGRAGGGGRGDGGEGGVGHDLALPCVAWLGQPSLE